MMQITPKEAEILGLVKQGLRDKEISSHLGKSVQTIRNQLSSLYRKQGWKNRAQAIAELTITHLD